MMISFGWNVRRRQILQIYVAVVILSAVVVPSNALSNLSCRHDIKKPIEHHASSLSPTNDDDVGTNRRDAIHRGINLATIVTSSTAATATGLLIPSAKAVADDNAASTTTKLNPIATLADGTPFPLASFGLQVYDDNTAYRLTMVALETGYRNFFASVLAGNQKGFAKAIKDSGIPRDQIYICGSVVSNRAQGYDAAKTATTKGWKRNMEAFGVGDITYLDQIMLDYPGPDCPSIQGQWSAFQEMHAQGLTKTLSVSNFSPSQLDCLLVDMKSKGSLTVNPVVNQLPYSVAYHPGNSVADDAKRGVLVQAWAPLGGSLGGRFDSKIKSECTKIGRSYNKSFAQVALRWIVQSGASFTTQSKNVDHFKEDLNIFDFELTDKEMTLLNSLA